jgi:hypothetical protein
MCSSVLLGPIRSLLASLFACFCPDLNWNQSQVKVMLRPTVSSASPSWRKAPIWGLRPDLYCCWTVAGLWTGIWIQFSYKHSAQTPRKTAIIVDVFTVPLLRNGLHNTIFLLLFGADDIETQPPLLLHNLTTDCLSRICLRGNTFTNTLPSNGCRCNNNKINYVCCIESVVKPPTLMLPPVCCSLSLRYTKFI